MERDRRRDGGEQAATTLEFTALAVALVAMLATVGPAMALHGDALARGIAGRMQRALDAPGPQHARGGTPHARAARTKQTAAALRAAANAGRWRDQREWREAGGNLPVRVGRDELRLSPIVDPFAVWSREWGAAARPAGVDVRARATACALCTALEWSHAVVPGAMLDDDGARSGIAANITGAARVAIASIDASMQVHRRIAMADVTAQGRARAALGAEADAEAGVQFGAATQELELDGTAMAGATARVQGRLGIDLLGIAIRHGGRAEGWAGAGVRGTVQLRRSRDRMEWRLGWGGALGLGGAAEWSGSVDVSAMPRRHRRLARDSLAVALRAALLTNPALHAPVNVLPR